MIKKLIDLAEKGIMPDFLIRSGIRRMQKERILWEKSRSVSEVEVHHQNWVNEMKSSSIAYVPEKANEQHYEVPPDFFVNALGKHLKYSSGFWPTGVTTLDDSEFAMLKLSAERAEITNGDKILELGCGWGSLSLWMATNYPKARITSISNSHSQREHILGEVRKRGLNNLDVLTEDINAFETDKQFDRVVSVEMFEHVRNHRELFSRIHSWLTPGGKLFTHVFCHRSTSYPFEVEGEDDWMSKHFFSGGTMPADELFLRISGSLELEKRWRWSGIHYAKTSECWLTNMDENREKILKILKEELSKEEARQTFHRWRIFFLACAETFRFRNGQEWWVSHYLFKKS